MIAHSTNLERTFLVGKLPITLRTSTRRTKGLEVTTDGQIIVRAPLGTSNTEAAALVRRRREWTYRQLHRANQHRPERPAKELVNGEVFTIQGVPHHLRLVDHDSQEHPIVQHRHTPAGPRLHIHRSLAAHPEQARNALIRWYAERAQDWLNAYGPGIVQYRGKTDLGLRVSTRLANALVAYKPARNSSSPGPPPSWPAATSTGSSRMPSAWQSPATSTSSAGRTAASGSATSAPQTRWAEAHS
ncbi:YgjP-like metallopeptidase domain-containing protein [Streptomyces sp. CA-135486]|uniref:YgjP-like metallopeptidase domain-containing protein n=1 Tax=Streptomyces sp. CA-135486 TaxID=3240049 RepID=UPI003D916110